MPMPKGSPIALALNAAHSMKLAQLAKDATSTASSVASSIPRPTGLAVAGAGVAVAAVAATGYFIDEEIKEHELEKIGKEVIAANAMAKPFFSRITVPGYEGEVNIAIKY